MGDGISIQTTLNQATKVARVQQGQQTSPKHDDAFARQLSQSSEKDIAAVKQAAEAEQARIEARDRKKEKRRRARKRARNARRDEEKDTGGKIDLKV